MSDAKTGGLEEAKMYMRDKEIPQLFESMMTALMFKKPEDHLDFLEQCLVKAKQQPKVKWHSFIEPLPPIPRTENEIKLESNKSNGADVLGHKGIGVKQLYSPLPPIANHTIDTNSNKEKEEEKEVDVISDISNTIAVDNKEDVKDVDVIPEDVKDVDVIAEDVKDVDVIAEDVKDDGNAHIETQDVAIEKVEGDDVVMNVKDDEIVTEDVVANDANNEGGDVMEDVKDASSTNEEIIVPELDESDLQKEVDTSCFADQSKPVIFVLGGPGSGKGTQCTKLVEKYSFVHLSAGDLLREEAKKGGNIADIMKEGALVPQEVTIGLLKQAMLDNVEGKGFLIDGFPREMEQGKEFERQVCSPTLLLNFSCADEIIVGRLIARGKHSGRVDDNEESIKKRLELFHEKTEPVIAHYGEIVRMIDSSRPIDEVFKDTCEALEKLSCFGDEAEDIAGEEVIVPVEENIIPGRGQVAHLLGDTIKNKTFLFVTGFQGCGKEEQCRKIVETFNFTSISITEILQAEISSGTERGNTISEIMEGGAIVSQEIVMELLTEAILKVDNADKILIDGFPRNIDEAQEFENEVAPVKLLIYFSCPDEALIERLSQDGDPESSRDMFKKQMESFEAAVLPLVKKYQERGIVHQISIQGSVEDTFVDVQKVFTELTEGNIEMTNELQGKNIIFVLGGPGSGKGTQCAKIVEKYAFTHLSTGDLLREEVSEEGSRGGSQRSDMISNIMKRGELVPQAVILELLREAMLSKTDCNGFLIDGFPRDIEQAEQFEITVGSCKFILYFECSSECMTERLLERAKTSGRADDNIDTIKLRLKTFEDQTKPVVEKYQDRVKTMNAERDVDAIFADVCSYFDTL